MGWDGMRDGNFFSIPGWDDPGIGIEIFFHPGIGRDRDRISRDDPGIGIEKSRGMVPFGTLIRIPNEALSQNAFPLVPNFFL